MSSAQRKHAAQIESLEPRTLMSSQPVGQVLSSPIDLDELPEVFPTLTDAHRLTGWDTARNDYGFNGRGQTVAVIDSGIASDHMAFARAGGGSRVVGGWDFAEGDNNPYDDGPSGSHGTHVAGIVGSSHSVHAGVAPGVDLVALRVFTDTGSGSFGWVEQALRWVHQNRHAYANPITTVNLSLGTSWNSETVPSWANLEDEFLQLKNDGIFISVSAGNSFTRYNRTGLSYPAASSYVVPVASVDDSGVLSSFSQRSQRVIAAPGQSVMSSVPDYRGNQNGKQDDFLRFSGTSMAAPYVAGASVVIRQALEFLGSTNVTQQTIYDWMRNTADTIHDSVTNLDYKRLDLRQALDAIMPADDFGSDLQTAHQLGTLSSTTVAGLIGKLSDRDFFRFTAATSGTVTVTANFTHGAVASWQVSGGGQSSSGSGATFTFNVTAGQSYTLDLGAGSLGFYNVTIATQTIQAGQGSQVNDGSQVAQASLVFDEHFYLLKYGDVRHAVQAGVFSSGLEHFQAFGQKEGRAAFAVFDEASYLAIYADVKAAVEQGWLPSGTAHYYQFGQAEGRSPSDLFNESYYLDCYADIRAAVEQGRFSSGLEHYVQFGQYEGRSGSASFDGLFYLNQYADVRAAVEQGWFASGIEHFVFCGRAEGRLGAPSSGGHQVVGPSESVSPANTWSSGGTAMPSASPETGSLSANLATGLQLSSTTAGTSTFSTVQPLSQVLEEASQSVQQELSAIVPQWGLPEENEPWRPGESLAANSNDGGNDDASPWISFKQRELIERVDELFASLTGD